MRILAALVLVLLCALASPTVAWAAEAAEVADEVSIAGFYIEPGSEEIDAQELEETLAATGNDVRPVILAESPFEGEDAFAEAVLSALGQQTTVIVISPEALEVVSAEATGDQIQQALEDAEQDVDLGTAGAGEIASAFARSYDEVVSAPRPPVAVAVAAVAVAARGCCWSGAAWPRPASRRSRPRGAGGGPSSNAGSSC